MRSSVWAGLWFSLIAACEPVHFVPTTVPLAHTYDKGSLAVTGAVGAPGSPQALMGQGQIQYAVAKNFFLLAGGYAQAGRSFGLFGGFYGSSFTLGGSAGAGYQTHVLPWLVLGFEGGATYQWHRKNPDAYADGGRFQYTGPWIQGFSRFMLSRKRNAFYIDAGLNYQYLSQHVTDYVFVPVYYPVQPRNWLNKDISVYSPFIGTSWRKGSREIFTRLAITPQRIEDQPSNSPITPVFFYSPYLLQGGITFQIR